MPLPKATTRKMLHLRDIQLRGYEREDGLIEVEGRITDVKTYGAGSRGAFEAGEPIHDMWLRVAIDREMVIRDCEAAMDATPHDACPLAAPNMQRLRGLKIGKGFIKAAMQLLGGGAGCTHLRELLQPVATVAFQTMTIYRQLAAPPGKKWINTDLVNSCYAYKEDGPLVTEYRAEAAQNPAD
jgi:hypothetical protein